MTSQLIKVTGKGKWFKVYDPDEFAGTKRWIIDFYPADGGEWEKIQKSGIKLVPKEDKETGEKFIRPRRPVQKVFGEDVVTYNPPQITGDIECQYVDEETGKWIDSTRKGDGRKVKRIGSPVTIGNDSEVEVTIQVYDTAIGKGHRLMGINVLNLNRYVKEEITEETTNILDDEEENMSSVSDDSSNEEGDEVTPW